MKINGLISESIDYVNPVSITDTANLDFNKHYIVTVTSADKTLTLPAISGNGGKLISIFISPSTTKLITIDGNSSETIDGTTTRIMWAGEACTLLNNGSEWNKIAGKSIPMISTMFLKKSQTINLTTWTTVEFTHLVSSAPSSFSELNNYRFKILRTSNYEYKTAAAFAATTGANILFLYLGVNGTASGEYPRCYQQSPANITMNLKNGFVSSFDIGTYIDTKAYVSTAATSLYYDGSSTEGFMSLIEFPNW